MYLLQDRDGSTHELAPTKAQRFVAREKREQVRQDPSRSRKSRDRCCEFLE